MTHVFPDVETVRKALNEFPPNKLEFFKETDVNPQWVYNFMAARPGGGSPKYPNIVKIIRWLESRHNVRFTAEDAYTVQ